MTAELGAELHLVACFISSGTSPMKKNGGDDMSGVKRYDRTELLDRAMDLFHRQGFHGTSTAGLVVELGVNRKSMYAEFGSK